MEIIPLVFRIINLLVTSEYTGRHMNDKYAGFLLIFGSVVWQCRCTPWPAAISGPFPLKDKVRFPCSVCSWYPAQQVAHVGRHCYLSWWHRINWKRSALNLALPGKLREFCTYAVVHLEKTGLVYGWGLGTPCHCDNRKQGKRRVIN